jgi:hypothetical protein
VTDLEQYREYWCMALADEDRLALIEGISGAEFEVACSESEASDRLEVITWLASCGRRGSGEREEIYLPHAVASGTWDLPGGAT